MVKCENRSYLYALFGLTVCVSLYEIAFVQHANLLTSGKEKQPHLPGDGAAVPETIYQKEIHQNDSHNAKRSVEKSQNETHNRKILTVGRTNTELPTAISLFADSKQLPKNDFRNLIDIKQDFAFLINQSPCSWPSAASPPSSSSSSPGSAEDSEETAVAGQSKLLILVLVHSAPKNFRKRLTIRQTWGGFPHPAMRVFFLVGRVNSPELQMKLEMENERFRDLIQGNFVDAYRNMTYKHIMALKWFTYFCQDAPVLLKTDDDVFVNTPALIEYVRDDVDNVRTKRRVVKCLVVKNGLVKRSYRSKWRVSVKEYPHSRYPPYCPGFIVLYSADMAMDLYREAQRTNYFWIDDVHVTGTLVQQLNETLTPFRDTYFTKKSRKRLIEPYVRNMPLFTSPDLQEVEIRQLWTMVMGLGKGGERKKKKPTAAMLKDLEVVNLLAEDYDKSGGRRMGRTGEGIYVVMLGAVLFGSLLGGNEFGFIAR